MQLKLEKKSLEVHQAMTEKVQLENIVKSKDQMIDTLNRQINQLREDLKSKDLEQETAIRRKHEEERQRELQDKNDNAKLFQEVEIVKKQKLEIESSLRIEVQKWRSDAEFADRKLRNSDEELVSLKHKMKEIKTELESTQRMASNAKSGLDNGDKFRQVDQEH
jgi:chromosome segregation ATPase